MKKKLLGTILFLAAFSLLPTSAQKKLSIQTDPNNGASGDIIQVKVRGGQISKDAEVMIGNQRALTIAASDSTISVMVPPIPAKKTTIVFRQGNQKAETSFTVNGPATVRLWFNMKDNRVSFYRSQYTNEEYVQDKSTSTEKMMYEIYDANKRTLAKGYINSPRIFEVVSDKEKGFSKTELKEELRFSITVPVLTTMSGIKLSLNGASTKYRDSTIATLSVAIK